MKKIALIALILTASCVLSQAAFADGTCCTTGKDGKCKMNFMPGNKHSGTTETTKTA
jgi:hypothetical protein